MSRVANPDNDSYPITYKTEAHRFAKCVNYERATVREILKEGYVCHVGFDYNDSTNPPYHVVLPTLYALDTNPGPTGPERLYLHGLNEARLYTTAARDPENGVPVCLTVSLVDGLLLAERAFWHGIYYRSVMVYGNAIPVTNPGDKMAALQVLVEHMFKGRWNDTDHPDVDELGRAGVLRLELTEASAKILDSTTKLGKCDLKYEEDQDPEHWSGVIPVGQAYCHPQPNEATIKAGIGIPPYLKGYHRPQHQT